MTNQEKRTKSGEIILSLIQNKAAATVAEVERKTKLPHEEVVAFFKDLENAGQGRFIVGRRGSPSRFVRFADPRREGEQKPLDVRLVSVAENAVRLCFSTKLEGFPSLLETLKKSDIKTFSVDYVDTGIEITVLVELAKLGAILQGLQSEVTN